MISRTTVGKFKQTFIHLGIFKFSVMRIGFKKMSIRFETEWGWDN